MRQLIDTGLPALIMLAMTAVGLELTIADLRRVLHYPMQIGIALIGQMILLPLLAALLIMLLRPQPVVAGGLLLTAAAPQAISSNYYCLVARADVALSVTLTAVSSGLAIITTPLVAALAFDMLLAQEAGIVLPAGKVMQQIASGLLLPVTAGMIVRHYAGGFVERNRAIFQRASMVIAIAIVIILAVDQAATIWRYLASIVAVAIAFTLVGGALGLALAKGFSWNREDTVTLMAAFPSRSLSVATLIAVNVLGRLEFLSFAVVFYVVQSALLIAAMIALREPQKPAQ